MATQVGVLARALAVEVIPLKKGKVLICNFKMSGADIFTVFSVDCAATTDNLRRIFILEREWNAFTFVNLPTFNYSFFGVVKWKFRR